MIRTVSSLALLLTACAGLPAPSEVVQVEPPTGHPEEDRKLIVAALEQAQPGATLRFAAGTYHVGRIVRVATPDLTLLGHPDGTTLRGGDYRPDRDFGADPAAVDALGVLHLFEGGVTVRGLTFEDSFWGLVLGWNFGFEWDDRRPEKQGGFRIEGNHFRNSRFGVRAVSDGSAPTIVRGNTFVAVNSGVSVLGSGFVIEGNDLRMDRPVAAEMPSDAVCLGAERLAEDCSENRIADNVISGYRVGVCFYTDGRRVGVENVVRGNRIGVCGDDEASVGIELSRRRDRDDPGPATGGLVGTRIEGNHVTGARRAGIEIGTGCDDSRVLRNTFDELQGPAILIRGEGTVLEGHAPGVEVRHPGEASTQGD